MSKYTLGPWKYIRDSDYYSVVSEADGSAIIVGEDNMEGNEADYNLITAAPDLFDALNDIYTAYKAELSAAGIMSNERLLFIKCQQALAKAEGTQS